MGSDNPFGECLTNERILDRLQNCSIKEQFLNYDRRLTRVDYLFDEQQDDHNHWPAMERVTKNCMENEPQRSQVHTDPVNKRLDCYMSRSVEAAYFAITGAGLHIRLKSRSMKRTVFIPTNRPEKQLALDHGLVGRLQILVAPGGAWAAVPEAYFPHLTNGWMLLVMPDSIDLSFLPADHLLRNCFIGGKRPCAEYGKIEFSRLFIQLFAHAVGLSEVWVLDDNITKCERRNIVDSAGGEKNWQVGPGSIQRVGLEEFMQQLRE
ncbi:hypothetical protein SARC_04492 [Sphaeroforma arctica JP610]|uniref:Uncharacterized protein n=1 Tax=Sphaeroforma arctica JP610 TaxID=667725 RepID=A0A0L0G2F7_9EUKA|nr:hypothetical protein SARC_04492 [Sphaeroforma arctica JP610]KNC83255.1 hypothetical protein SARC_04492 [Sphaeroforma arctica JP610]|eukprot:XP_014157157.1 hypothetical protein SARC_04492 [Sphaeroforma arctica JP610]